MKVKQVPVGELKPAAYNPRHMPDDEREALERSVREFGLVAPIVANADGTVIGGHQRLEAAKAVGLAKVPVVYVDLDPAGERQLNVALNRIRGDWDDQALANVLKGLMAEGRDPTLTGLSEREVARRIGKLEVVAPEEFPDVDEAPGTLTCAGCGYEWTP